MVWSYGDESPEGIKLAIDTCIAPVLKTCDVSRVAETMSKIGRNVVGNHIAKCAVETALLDAAGKRLSVPVSELHRWRSRARPPRWSPGRSRVEIRRVTSRRPRR